MDNLVDLFKQQIGKQAVEQIGKQFGVDSGKTNGILDMALPMLMSGMGRNASEPTGAEALSKALKEDHDGSILDKLQEVIGQKEEQEEGNKILQHIFGEKQPNVLGALEKSSGESSTNVMGILSTLAPILMGFLGKQQQSQNLDASSLAAMLSGQKEQADSQLGGLSKLLDMDGDGSIMDDVLSLGKKFF